MALNPDDPTVNGPGTNNPDEIPARPPGMTGETETAAIIESRSSGERGKIKMAVAFMNVVTYQLYRDFGLSCVEEWVEEKLLGEPSAESLQDWAKIATHFTEDQAASFTCHKLSHLLTYVKLHGITDVSNPGEIPIEICKDPPIVVPFKECKVVELERALRGEPTARPAHLVAFDEKARELQTWLKSESVLGPASFAKSVVQRRGRSAVIQIDNLSIEEVDKLKAMRSQP